MWCLSNRARCGWIRCSVGLLAATALSFGAPPVHPQALVEYEFTGFVTDNSGDLGIFGPFHAVQINDVFTGRFSYMTGPGNPDQLMGDPETGFYNVTDFVIDQAFVAITPAGVGVIHQPGILTLPPLPPDLGTDGFRVIGSFLSGQDTKSVSLQLEAPYQTVFTDDSLPTTLTLTDFPDLQSVVSIRVLGIEPNGMDQLDVGQLTSLVQVPEPSSVVLGLLGFGFVGLCVRPILRYPTGRAMTGRR